MRRFWVKTHGVDVSLALLQLMMLRDCTKTLAVHASIPEKPVSQSANDVPDETQPEQSEYAAFSAFDANISTPLKLAGRCLVFVRDSELIFVRRDGGGAHLIAAVPHLLGPVAGIVGLFTWLGGLVVKLISNQKSEDQKEEPSDLDPYELIQAGEPHLKLHVSEIRHAQVLPRTFWTLSQGKAGRIDFAIRLGEQLQIEFAEADELATALHLLEPLLSNKLQVNVAWNPAKQCFERKRPTR